MFLPHRTELRAAWTSRLMEISAPVISDCIFFPPLNFSPQCSSNTDERAATQDCTLSPCSWYHWLKYELSCLHLVFKVGCFTSSKPSSGGTVDSTNSITFSCQCSVFAIKDCYCAFTLHFASASLWKSFTMAWLSPMTDSRHLYPKAHRYQFTA